MKSKYKIILPDELGYTGMDNYRIGEDDKPYRISHVSKNGYLVSPKLLIPANPKFNLGENAYYFRLTKNGKTRHVRFKLEQLQSFLEDDTNPVNLTI